MLILLQVVCISAGKSMKEENRMSKEKHNQ